MRAHTHTYTQFTMTPNTNEANQIQTRAKEKGRNKTRRAHLDMRKMSQLGVLSAFKALKWNLFCYLQYFQPFD